MLKTPACSMWIVLSWPRTSPRNIRAKFSTSLLSLTWAHQCMRNDAAFRELKVEKVFRVWQVAKVAQLKKNEIQGFEFNLLIKNNYTGNRPQNPQTMWGRRNDDYLFKWHKMLRCVCKDASISGRKQNIVLEVDNRTQSKGFFSQRTAAAVGDAGLQPT